MVEYVFGVYNSLIVAVYKPSEWFVCKEAKDRLPRQDIVLTPKTENRLFLCGWKIWAGISVGWEWIALHWKVDSQIEVESVGTESDYISVSTGER